MPRTLKFSDYTIEKASLVWGTLILKNLCSFQILTYCFIFQQNAVHKETSKNTSCHSGGCFFQLDSALSRALTHRKLVPVFQAYICRYQSMITRLRIELLVRLKDSPRICTALPYESSCHFVSISDLEPFVALYAQLTPTTPIEHPIAYGQRRHEKINSIV